MAIGPSWAQCSTQRLLLHGLNWQSFLNSKHADPPAPALDLPPVPGSIRPEPRPETAEADADDTTQPDGSDPSEGAADTDESASDEAAGESDGDEDASDTDTADETSDDEE